MKFSIITPSFRNSNWLKLCIASVADQQGSNGAHCAGLVLGRRHAGLVAARPPRQRLHRKKTAAMYDAVNRGYRRAQGDISRISIATNNPARRAQDRPGFFLKAHPKIEVALAGTIVTDGAGKYICHRQALVPHPHHICFRSRC